MGEEAPEYLLDFSDELPPIGYGYGSDSESYRTITTLGEKIYIVGESSDGMKLSIDVKIFDNLTGVWTVPIVVGTHPIPSKGHSAILLNNDRILILKWGSLLDDFTWLLEVDTPFVREQKEILGTEVVAWSKGVLGDGALPIVISGPSGVGKGTLISKLMKEFPSTFGFSVSHTTRAPREKEMNGVHYHFTERSIMENDIRDKKFLESALVHGNLYGTSIEAVESVADAGKRCILDIDVQGAKSVRASCLEAIFIFIRPPSFEELENRLRARGTETEEQVQKRLRNARSELDQGKSTGLFDHILVNDDLESCYRKLKKILALNVGNNALDQSPMKNFRIPPLCHAVSQVDQNVVIHCGSNELGAENPRLFTLDASLLKGGAPCRTRGLRYVPSSEVL